MICAREIGLTKTDGTPMAWKSNGANSTPEDGKD